MNLCLSWMLMSYFFWRFLLFSVSEDERVYDRQWKTKRNCFLLFCMSAALFCPFLSVSLSFTLRAWISNGPSVGYTVCIVTMQATYWSHPSWLEERVMSCQRSVLEIFHTNVAFSLCVISICRVFDFKNSFPAHFRTKQT